MFCQTVSNTLWLRYGDDPAYIDLSYGASHTDYSFTPEKITIVILMKTN